MKKMKREDVFTTGDVARICRVSNQTIIRCFDSGKLKGFRVPGSRSRRILRQGLVRFMRENNIPMDRLKSGKKRVLIIDDDTEIVEQLVGILAKDGRFEAMAAQSSYEAGIMTQRFRPNLVMLDYMLPCVDCSVICHTIRNNSELRNTRIIIVSGVIRQGEIDRLLKSGADDFVRKPFTADDIISNIKTALQIK